jgi:hypothetical protein
MSVTVEIRAEWVRGFGVLVCEEIGLFPLSPHGDDERYRTVGWVFFKRAHPQLPE